MRPALEGPDGALSALWINGANSWPMRTCKMGKMVVNIKRTAAGMQAYDKGSQHPWLPTTVQAREECVRGQRAPISSAPPPTWLNTL